MYYSSHQKHWHWEKNLFLQGSQLLIWPVLKWELQKPHAIAEWLRAPSQRLGWEARGSGQGRWLCSAIMKGQSHRGFKRLVSIQKMKSSSLWIASLVLRFKYISWILCVLSHFNVSPPPQHAPTPPPAAIPLFLFIISPVSVSSKTVALSYLKPQQLLSCFASFTNSMIFLRLSFVCLWEFLYYIIHL